MPQFEHIKDGTLTVHLDFEKITHVTVDRTDGGPISPVTVHFVGGGVYQFSTGEGPKKFLEKFEAWARLPRDSSR
jgi:hypothetical protein